MANGPKWRQSKSLVRNGPQLAAHCLADFDLHRIFEKGYPSLKVTTLMGSASDYQEIVEQFVPVMRNQITVHFRARMKREFPDLDEDELSEPQLDRRRIACWLAALGRIRGWRGRGTCSCSSRYSRSTRS